MASLDPTLHHSLMQIKRHQGRFDELALCFTAARDGSADEVDLVPDGRNVAVTRDNCLRFIALLAHFKLNTQVRAQTAAFLRGLQDLIQPAWFELFGADELQLLISGSGRVDVRDWRAHTVYNGWTLDEERRVIGWFWETVDEMSDAERRQLLLFSTSCSRAPLLGFSALTPKFCVNAGSANEHALPSASTCMNLLKLPRYTSKEQLRAKLLLAIASQSGFELS
jgi:ubiquitin-protein ligase E3 C